jgi:CubicO group peptidase (beta-lactamase class C family)/D-alanyl-D-alanine dipeptidase
MYNRRGRKANGFARRKTPGESSGPMNGKPRHTHLRPLFSTALGLVVAGFLFTALRAAPSSGQETGAAIAAAPRYRNVATALERLIEREIQDKKLPGFSIALVDDQRIVWARGFGYADPERKWPATAATVYRVATVSRLFTDLAILRRVDRGAFSLDAPVGQYLPAFHPRDPYATPITLRELMADRSGLVRDPPVGSIYDARSPSLVATALSLNRTTLVYWPSTHVKYSDAAGAVTGEVLERETGESFARYMQQAVFDPLGMRDSSFAPDARIRALGAKGAMWTYDGREIPTPTFALGVAPAEGLYSNAIDLGRFLEFLFAGGRAPKGPLLGQQTLEQMWAPQFAQPGDKTGYGLGFVVSDFDGHRLIDETGSLYGFTTELAALPGEKLGVVAMTNLDGANGATMRVASAALQLMLAARQGKRLPAIPEPTSLPAASVRSLAGRYGSIFTAFDLIDEENRLFYLPIAGGPMIELRRMGDSLILDGRLGWGRELTLVKGGIRVRHTIFPSYTLPKPGPAPERWKGLIGEYGPDYATIYILEKDGKLNALVDWFNYIPLREISRNVYEFPPSGLYDGEHAFFTRDAQGVATELRIGSVVFPRRKLGGTEGPFFHIHPVKQIAELRREALRAKPPVETGNFLKPDLVDVTSLDPKIKLDIRYATNRDFLATPVYTEAKAFMQRPAAEALARVARKLESQGYGLLIHDAYRPWYVTKIFWDATPPDKHRFVADPAEGSRHNRGCAVDLTLYNLATGEQVPMTGHYDEMTERSYPYYPGGTSIERWDRNLLRRAMESEGFTVYEFEWWHFDYKDWRRYPILNLTFEQLSSGTLRDSSQ